METKEVKITIPEGYEIDKEHSTFECIKFKKKVEVNTWKDIRTLSGTFITSKSDFYYVPKVPVDHIVECLSMSYAKYLYTSHYKEFVDAKYYQIDHIDGNKLNDDIKNLQRISREYNARKDKKIKEYVELECPICHTKFLFEKRNLNSHPNPCCSRSCGGKKSRLKKI